MKMVLKSRTLVRRLSHLCAPVFLFLAGLAPALSVARKMAKNTPAREIDKFLLSRGLFIALVDALCFVRFWDRENRLDSVHRIPMNPAAPKYRGQAPDLRYFGGRKARE